MADRREFDVVLWGATGFTGRLAAEQLLRRVGADGDLRWAIGGRSREKLERLRTEIGDATGIGAADLPLVVGDSREPGGLDDLTKRTRVVCSTVGPYALYGTPLVEACVANGTHYCDLTGEVHWMQQMIETSQRDAVASGARLVFTCGFDCIPADVGTWFMHREMRDRHGVPCASVAFRVAGASGGASGGTIASVFAMMEAAAENPDVKRAMEEPYSLNPLGQRFGPDKAERTMPWFDDGFDQWVAPFTMATIDTKVVRRTNALLGHPYGEDFRYDEGVLCGAGPLGRAKATATGVGSMVGTAALSIGPLRRQLAGRVPQPGSGPSREKQEKGYFDIRFRGTHPTDDGIELWGRVRGDRDPGYGSTAKMLVESALALAEDELDVGGGFWTPASAMGDQLLARLPEHAGVTFSIEE